MWGWGCLRLFQNTPHPYTGIFKGGGVGWGCVKVGPVAVVLSYECRINLAPVSIATLGKKKQNEQSVPYTIMVFRELLLSASPKVSHKRPEQGVHTHRLTACERKHWFFFLRHLSHF